MRGYKIFGPEYTCKNHKYTIDLPNVYNGNVKLGQYGFHFCPRAVDCLNYYDYTPYNTYAEVECEEYKVDGERGVCKVMKVKPLTYEEFGELLTGDIDTKHKKCSYVKGKLNGSYCEWYTFDMYKKKVKRVETTYVDGKLHGKYLQLSLDGVLKINCNYDHGILHGKYLQVFDDGAVVIKTNYSNGEIHGSYIKLWSEGHIEESTFINGVRTGIYKKWKNNNKTCLLIECTYKNNLLHGHYKEWYPNRNLRFEKNYVKGILHGDYKEWDEDGKLRRELEYEYGQDFIPSKYW